MYLPKDEDNHGYIEIFSAKKAVYLHYLCPKRGTSSLLFKTKTNNQQKIKLTIVWLNMHFCCYVHVIITQTYDFLITIVHLQCILCEVV